MSYKSNILINNKKHLFFGGTAYLGLNFNADIIKLINHGFEQFGTNYGASRLNDTCYALYNDTEKKMANWLGLESSVLCSSGTVAAMILLNQLKGKYHFLHFEDLHPSLANNLLGEELTIISRAQDITTALKTLKLSNKKKTCLLVNSINPIQLLKTNFDFLINWSHELLLVIDDSHGFGVIGESGEGIMTELKDIPSNVEIIILGSLGKSMSIPAGIIAGDKNICQRIKNDPIWAGSAPTTPAFIHCLNNMDEIVELQREKLSSNIDYFMFNYKCDAIFESIDNYPVFKFKTNGFTKSLKDNGIIISGLSYPSITDPFVERVVINSLHTKDNIDQLFNVLNDI